MKPIKLTMTAFGPYKQQEVIEFNELKDNRLFVISGTTGSGKTTIFDGICFALYGQASGEDRTDVRSLRSDFAEDSVQTAVELVFSIQERTYRIMRQIPYIKKGNKTETPAAVEFYEVTEDGEIPCVDRQIVTEVNEKAEQLIGFTAAQFNQIVMLPQGEFRKFLTSTTENKETIMRKIFQTEPYRVIVERLKIKRAEIDKEWSVKSEQHRQYIAQIAAQLPARTSTVFEVLEQEHYNVAQLLTGLEEEQTFYTNKEVEDNKLYETSVERYEKMVEYYHVAKQTNEKFSELERQTNTLTAMTKEIDVMKANSEKLELAEKAVLIEQLEWQWRELVKEQSEKKAVLNQAITHVESTSKQLEEVRKRYEFEEQRSDTRKEYGEKLIGYKNLLPTVADLDKQRQRIDQLHHKGKEYPARLQTMQQKITEESTAITTAQKKISELEESLNEYETVTDRLSQVTTQLDLVKEYKELEARVMQSEKQKERAKTEYNEKKETYDEQSRLWFTSEAATLAESLHDGEACPVCGSIEHPHKATVHEQAATKEDVELARQALAKVESAFRSVLATFEMNQENLLNQQKKLQQQQLNYTTIEATVSELMTVQQTTAEHVAKLRENRNELNKLRISLKELTERYEEHKQLLQQEEEKYDEIMRAYEQELGIYEHTLTSIPEDVQKLPVLEQKIKQLEAEVEQLESAWTRIQQAQQEMNETVSKANSAKEFAEQSITEVTNKVITAEKKFMERVTTSNFASVEEYVSAKIPEQERTKLREMIGHFKQQYYAIRESKQELEIELKNKEQLNLGEIETTLNELKKQYEVAYQEKNRSIELGKRVKQITEAIELSYKEVEEVEQEYSKITHLYDVVRGHNHLKLSFERYIQIEYLEQIIFSANERLRDISNGQFELIRSDRQESRGRQSGLGLDVYDAYTGQNRDVKTLSGGEKFNASLALALGMADVIQSFQGAVSIDTMFIDEGFGSLDGESLNKAIDTLIDLQKSGRMIGVISHVEELKAALPAILEVNKSKEGHSSTRFIIK